MSETMNVQGKRWILPLLGILVVGGGFAALGTAMIKGSGNAAPVTSSVASVPGPAGPAGPQGPKGDKGDPAPMPALPKCADKVAECEALAASANADPAPCKGIDEGCTK